MDCKAKFWRVSVEEKGGCVTNEGRKKRRRKRKKGKEEPRNILFPKKYVHRVSH